jgi:hypothetical protein
MTQLGATLNLLIERYPEAVSHGEAMQIIGWGVRTRVSELHDWFGIKCRGLNNREDKVAHGIDPKQKQAWYVLEQSPEEALALYREGRGKGKGSESPPMTSKGPQNAPTGLSTQKPNRQHKIAGRNVGKRVYHTMNQTSMGVE